MKGMIANMKGKAKSTLGIIIFLVLLFNVFNKFSVLFDEFPNPFDYARITDVSYKGIIVDEPESYGKIAVTERITFDVHAASKDNPFWELWRDLPESYIDGEKVDYTVKSVKQILDDGTEIIYEESPKLYWDDSDYLSSSTLYGPGKWYHSEGPYSEYSRQYECLLFYVDGIYRENITFEIEYEMNNAAFRYGDCSELYLSFYSGDTIKYLDSFNAQILIPNKDMPRNGNYESHTYGTSLGNFAYTESANVNPGYYTFSFNLDKEDLKFDSYSNYLEFTLISYGTDKHKFTDYASRNLYYYDNNVLPELRYEHQEYEEDYNSRMNLKKATLFVCLIASALVIAYIYFRTKKIEKDNTFYEPYEQIDYFREIPSDLDPLFASELVFCKDSLSSNYSNAYSAIVLDLVRKGYISTERIDNSKDWTSNNVKIIVNYKPTSYFNNNELVNSDMNINDKTNLEPLTPSEDAFFKLIIRHSKGNEISMDEFQKKISSDYDNTNSFVKNVENSTVNLGISQGYFQRANFDYLMERSRTLSTFFMLLGIAFIVIINPVLSTLPMGTAFGGFTIFGCVLIICSIYLKKVSKKYILLTQFGENEYTKWRGLYNFLKGDTLMNERTIIELPLWEKYLVYATAFGISQNVISALKIRCEDTTPSPMLSNSYYLSSNFYVSISRFESSAHSASYQSRYSSGIHGGYGGRWPWWWRWPEEVIKNKRSMIYVIDLLFLSLLIHHTLMTNKS